MWHADWSLIMCGDLVRYRGGIAEVLVILAENIFIAPQKSGELSLLVGVHCCVVYVQREW